MLRRTSITDAYVITVSILLAIGGIYYVTQDQSVGWWLLLAGTLSAILVISRPFTEAIENDAQRGEKLDVSPWGVRRYDGAGLTEGVSWSDLSEVDVVATPATPDVEDVYLVLRGQSTNGLIVPHTLAVESGILNELERRLGEFDNQAFIDALSSTVDKVFVLWRASGPTSRFPSESPLRAPAH